MLTGLLGVPALLALIAFALAALADAPEKGEEATPVELRRAPKDMESAGWIVTFEDTFPGDTLDRSRWLDSYPHDERTHSNNEQQYYAPDGVTVENGRLVFTAQQREMGGMPYTSGMVSSFGKFSQQYGWFEIRARFPKGQGYWPAFWLLPDDESWPPEIDVMELLGHETDMVYMSNHYRNAEARHEYETGKFAGPDYSEDFHTFAAEWEAGLIVWYVDGVERYRTTENVPDVPMYVLANLAVGGDWPGMPDETTPFPRTMEIEHIRVYKRR